jgi:hypothetical protein
MLTMQYNVLMNLDDSIIPLSSIYIIEGFLLEKDVRVIIVQKNNVLYLNNYRVIRKKDLKGRRCSTFDVKDTIS